MGPWDSSPTAFSLLPKSKAPWLEFVFSTGGQACVVGLLASVRMLHPGIVSPPEHVFRSVQLVSTPVPVNLRPQPESELPIPVHEAHLEPDGNALRLPAPQPQLRLPSKIETITAPAVKITSRNLQPIEVPSTTELPRVVATNVFAGGSSADPTTLPKPAQIQTGGFGDPNGIPAKKNSGKSVNVAASGSFDLPAASGRGNGSGGSMGSRGVMASSGFGNGIATGASSANPSRAIQSTGFGDAGEAVPANAKSRTVEVSSTPVLPAEILSKPTPVYTQEARTLKIEGEVLVEVLLEASGQSHVVRVVRGLGHGLDDNAVKAVEQIRFKPAMRNGQAADSTVVMHIIFHLA